MEIRLSFGGFFVVLKCNKLISSKEIAANFSKKLANIEIDWVPGDKDNDLFGLVSLNSAEAVDGLKELIEGIPTKDQDYEIIYLS